jgi:hypothetical protein
MLLTACIENGIVRCRLPIQSISPSTPPSNAPWWSTASGWNTWRMASKSSRSTERHQRYMVSWICMRSAMRSGL